MTMKTLLLRTAAGFVTLGTTFGAAQAADLPMTKAEPVEYVRICSEFGEGFYYIPGTDTCLRISGYVRADYWWFEPETRADDGLSFRGRGKVDFDARTATEWGTLRSFVSFEYNRSHPTGNGVRSDKAFIQFGGWTAGYATSFYDFYDAEAGNTMYGTYFASSATTHLLAYTAVFGDGLAATISVEDNYYRRSGLLSPRNAVQDSAPDPYYMYGGQRAPDVVASLRWTQGWGSAQIMAAAHHNRSDWSSSTNLNLAALPGDSEWGWAIGAGAIFNLPSGFFFALEGSYTRGAASYAGLGDRIGNDVIDASLPGPGAANNDGDISLSRAWSVTGDLGYNFNPSLVGHIVVGYADYEAPSIQLPNGAAMATNQLNLPGMADFETWAVTANLTYTIVKGLTIAVEVSHEDRDYRNNYQTVDGNGDPITIVGPDDYDTWAAGMRLKRSF